MKVPGRTWAALVCVLVGAALCIAPGTDARKRKPRPVVPITQAGPLNYAGPNCPGSEWNCTTQTTKITQNGADNRFDCTRAACDVVQTATAAGTNDAKCRQGTGIATVQSCSITQSSVDGPNTADIEQTAAVTDARPKVAMTSGQNIVTDQRSTGTGTNTLELDQVIGQNAVSTGKTKKSKSQSQEARTSADLYQSSQSGTQTIDIEQRQTLRARAISKKAVAQKQNTIDNGQPNITVDVDQLSTDGDSTFDVVQRLDLDQSANAKRVLQTQGSDNGGADVGSTEGIPGEWGIETVNGHATANIDQEKNWSQSANAPSKTQAQIDKLRIRFLGRSPHDTTIIQNTDLQADPGAEQRCLQEVLTHAEDTGSATGNCRVGEEEQQAGDEDTDLNYDNEVHSNPASVSGRVSNEENNTAVGGAAVTMLDSGGDPVANATTDSAGHYAVIVPMFEGDAPQDYDLHVSSPHFPFRSVGVNNLAPGEIRVADVGVSSAVSISGHVEETDGDPISGATVSLVGSDEQTTTDLNGDYAFTGVYATDTATVHAEKQDYQENSATVTTAPGQASVEPDIVLADGLFWDYFGDFALDFDNPQDDRYANPDVWTSLVGDTQALDVFYDDTICPDQGSIAYWEGVVSGPDQANVGGNYHPTDPTSTSCYPFEIPAQRSFAALSGPSGATITWTSPIKGLVDISGTLQHLGTIDMPPNMANQLFADGISWKIKLNSLLLSEGDLDDQETHEFIADGGGLDHALGGVPVDIGTTITLEIDSDNIGLTPDPAEYALFDLTISTHPHGRHGLVYGFVNNAYTGQAPPGAEVSIDGADPVPVDDGYFVFSDQSVGEHFLHVTAPGYQSQGQPVFITNGGQTAIAFALHGPATWDAKADFIQSPNQMNPSDDSHGIPGVWSYLLDDSASDQLLDDHFPDICGSAGDIDSWEQVDDANSGAGFGVNFHPTDAATCLFADIPADSALAVVQGPDDAVLQWTSFVNGKIDIAGSLEHLVSYDVTNTTPVTGDGIDWRLEHNGSVLTSGTVDDLASMDLADGSGHSTALDEIEVVPGDTIRLEFSSNNTQFGNFGAVEYTLYDFVVTVDV